MQVIVLKNAVHEGPGTIGDYLAGRGVRAEVVEPDGLGSLPSVSGFDAVVVMGGPMGMYEMDAYPHLRACAGLVDEAIGLGKRLLGVCLGAQMIAQCLGARVYKGHAEEIGWMDVELTTEGLADPVAAPLAEDGRARVFQWHGDTFELPAGAVRLAGSEVYENQAFRYGEAVYALQFHVEVTPSMVEDWFEGRPEARRIMEETERIYEPYRARAIEFYGRFFGNI